MSRFPHLPLLLAFALSSCLWAPLVSAEVANAPGEVSETDEVDGESQDEELPAAAARRRHLVEPLGDSPSPWIALAGRLEGSVTVGGDEGSSSVRVHVPVARRYGALDARLHGRFSSDGLLSLGPEFVLRGVPLQLADGRGTLGFSFTFTPLMDGYDPIIILGGGLMGGYLGQRWFTWAHVGVRGEVLFQSGPDLLTTIAVGLRLPLGFRPQVEVDIIAGLDPAGRTSVVVRPGLRYWPAEFIGIGVAADIWAYGEDIEMSSIRFELVGHALE